MEYSKLQAVLGDLEQLKCTLIQGVGQRYEPTGTHDPYPGLTGSEGPLLALWWGQRLTHVSRHPCAPEVAATGVWTKGVRQLEKKLSCAGRARAWEELPPPHPQAAPTLSLPVFFLR